MVTPPPIELANLGMADSLILMVLALVVFGPRRLPQIGRQIGKLMYEFRKASNDFKFQMEEELRVSEDTDRRNREDAERAKLAAVSTPPTVEAQADIGAVEPPAAGTPSPYPGEEVYPPPVAGYSPREPQVLPRVAPVIQPPSSGQPIPAERPGIAIPALEGTEIPHDREVEGFDAGASIGAAANIGAEPPSATETDLTRTETIDHHA